ncbi:MAG TPA: DciA family protein [Hyphomonadaceae bacterium]|nr:DciA family protein [Hyphomonadaceae bacterium]
MTDRSIIDRRIREAEKAAEARLAEVRAVPVYRPARPMGVAVSRALRPILKQAGPAPETLASRWSEIVGIRLAGMSTPLRVAKGKSGGVLHIRAPSAAAPILMHAAAHIIDRVNLASGSTIKSLKIVHTAPPAVPPHMAARPLSAHEREDLVRRLAPVRTPDIRNALAELGEAVLARPHGRKA